jgi:plastocyanin
MVLMLAGSAAALTGVFATHEPPAVSVLTGPSVPPGSSVTGPGPSATNVPDNAGVGGPLPAPGVPTSVATSVDPTSPTTVGTPPATPAPAVTTAGPAPTVTAPAATTTTATTSAPTTTVAVVGATQITVAVSQGILGCGFQPSSAGAVAGSTVRFRNDTASPLTIVLAPLPGAATTTISLLPGATSGANVLSTPGSYPVTCSSGGDSVVGRMTITVTGGP